MGLALVLKTAMTAGLFAACGSPEAKDENQISHLNLNTEELQEVKQKRRVTFKKHSESLSSGIPGYRLNLSSNTDTQTEEGE